MNQQYYLESSGKDSSLPRYLRLDRFPAIVGRNPDCSIRLSVDHISRMHARFDLCDGVLTVEDLGSTNGTFVNHQRISRAVSISTGDVVHLAGHEFRLMSEPVARKPAASVNEETVIGLSSLPKDFSLKTPAFLDLLDRGDVTGYCQPIVTAQGEPFGFELLGRSCHHSLDSGPDELFVLAAALDCETRLSRLFRRRCFEEASRAGIKSPLFFNNHPVECDEPDALMEELQELRRLYPDLKLVFEVHESAVTDLEAMAEIKRMLKSMDIGLAYDDFGAGQARLLELAEVPPDVIKFDKSLIRDMASRESPRYRILDNLNAMVTDLGVKTLMEGVEDERSADLCREIGIDYMQGYYFGYPAAILEPDDTAYHHSEKDRAP